MTGSRRSERRSEHSARHVGSGRSRSLTVVLVLALVLVVGAVAAVRYDLIDRWFGQSSATPSDPASIPPPVGVTAPAAPEPDAVAQPASRQGRLDAAKIRHVLQPLQRKHVVGPHVRAVVATLSGDGDVVDVGHGRALPASTTKLVTSTAALLALGPDHVFTTRVVSSGGRVVLVGGGDPYLRSHPDPTLYPQGSDVVTLARQAAKALRQQGVRRVKVGYDDSLFSGPAVNPRWEPGYVPSEVSPIESLWIDEGRDDRVTDPALAAGRAFADALQDAGISVEGTPQHVHAKDGATQLASADSPPLEQIVEHLLLVSDNNAAEVLLRQLGLAEGGSGSISAGRDAVKRVLGDAGVSVAPSVLYDGSGLSRDDRMDPDTLVHVLRLAASPQHPQLRSIISGLPVAGFTGSLATRFDEGPHAALGRVRAKTGTLSSVQALAGLATDLDGTPFVFVLMLDRINPAKGGIARTALDDVAAGLGACHCTR